jgi:shikimate dehydrogenase
MSSGPLQEIIAVLGSPAAGNPAQYLFERAFEAAGLDWRIMTCDVGAERLPAALAGAEAMGFRGCLVAGPLRRLALPLVATASPTARFAGGVGLVERTADGLAGHITDGRGVVETLRAHLDPAGRHAFVVGAGTTGRAVALELALAGAASVCVTDPNDDRGRALADDLAGLERVPSEWLPWADTIMVPAPVGIIVRATPATPSFDGLRPDIIFADVAPAAAPPASASAAGCCIIDGLEIRAVQAAIEFQAMTGVEADVELLREALEEYLS